MPADVLEATGVDLAAEAEQVSRRIDDFFAQLLEIPDDGRERP